MNEELAKILKLWVATISNIVMQQSETSSNQINVLLEATTDLLLELENSS